ncbi:MAG: hypothetical protein A3G18_01705 [Rhodospirillales bacterium RIFCSPLOWO2_12_FULL_58_28]|nr:MAG: hypothetical protein A3G18_01705 [Rhodospirillales bacterium RIFCSPLOWO2_12_FULL_58_28]
MTGVRKNRPKKTTQTARKTKSGYGRRAVYLAVISIGLFGGYMLGGLFKGKEIPQKFAETNPVESKTAPGPWYRSQSPPPAMVTASALPLFPDPMDDYKEPPLAYEESLPHGIYEIPTVSMPMPPPPAPEPEPLPMATPEPAPEAAPAEPLSWRRFAVATPTKTGKPKIILVIDDMGVDRKRTAQIIAIKGPLTLSFLTYADNLEAQTRAARAAGHELLLHVTMEPGSRTIDPGPNVLLTEHDPQEILKRLRWGLSRFDSFIGINNHMGSKFTADIGGMTVVMEEIKRRGLVFLDSRTSETTVGAALAKRFKVPYAERNIFLDNLNDEAAVFARLAEVERLARSAGFAIAIGHPRDATIMMLPKWIKEVEALGFVLAPLSSVIIGDGVS